MVLVRISSSSPCRLPLSLMRRPIACRRRTAANSPARASSRSPWGGEAADPLTARSRTSAATCRTIPAASLTGHSVSSTGRARPPSPRRARSQRRVCPCTAHSTAVRRSCRWRSDICQQGKAQKTCSRPSSGPAAPGSAGSTHSSPPPALSSPLNTNSESNEARSSAACCRAGRPTPAFGARRRFFGPPVAGGLASMSVLSLAVMQVGFRPATRRDRPGV